MSRDPQAPSFDDPKRPKTLAPTLAPAADFEHLAEEHMGWLRGWLRGRLGGDAELVDDLTQEALLRAFRNFPRLRDPERFAPWLYRTAQNLLRDHLRQRARRKVSLLSTEKLDAAAPPTDDPDSVSQRELADRVLETIRELPPRYREPLLLCHTEGLSYERIGRILGIKKDVVRVRICRARKMVRARLGDTT